MKVKTMIELLSLSTNLYMISKDGELIKDIKKLSDKGKEKMNEFMDDFSGDEEELTTKILRKAEQAKEELEHKIGEMVKTMYEKMNIAHTNQIKELEAQIDAVKRELALTEAKLIQHSTHK